MLQERRHSRVTLTLVRAFYLGIQEWALEDATWAQWAAPSPVRKRDTAGQAKLKRKAASEIHQRIRDRLPHLPTVAASADRHRADRAAFLAAVTSTPVGDTFEHNGTVYRRTTSKISVKDPIRFDVTLWAENTSSGEVIDAARAEDDAFWTWAIIEVLRHTGIRHEELLEITHLALVSYRLADTGELVPMLQIVPSKTNEERLLPID